jgi:hypothetical protein
LNELGQKTKITHACLRRSDDVLVQCEENRLRWKPLESAAELLRCVNLEAAMHKHNGSASRLLESEFILSRGGKKRGAVWSNLLHGALMRDSYSVH